MASRALFNRLRITWSPGLGDRSVNTDMAARTEAARKPRSIERLLSQCVTGKPVACGETCRTSLTKRSRKTLSPIEAAG